MMALIKAKLKELRNADVRYISLVDRAATRIPFRVLKRDKESEMIDLTRVFKKDSKVEPSVTAIVVYAQKEDKLTDAIRKSIADAGFKTDRVRKSDEETIVYSQVEGNEGSVLVRLSDQMVVSVKDFGERPEGLYGDVIKEQGFYPGMSMAVGIMHEKLMDLVAKSDVNMVEDVKKTLDEFSAYAQHLTTLPAAAFKADADVNAAVPHSDSGKETIIEGGPKKEVVEQPAGHVEQKVVPGLKGNEGSATEVKKEEAAAGEKKEEAKKDDAAAADDKKDCKTCSGKGKIKEGSTKCPDCGGSGFMAKKEEAAVEKKEEVQKSEMQQVLDAIAGVKTDLTIKIGDVATKLEGVVKEQSTFKDALDGVSKKADTLESTLKGTVVAGAKPEDRPAGEHKEVKKADSDPRTGCFDTAFIARGNRRR